MLSISHARQDAGFSLIELLVGIAIIAIVLFLGLPGYRQWIQNTQIRTAAESIQNGLQVARMEATRRNTRVQFVFTGADSGWSVGCVNVVDPDCPAAIQDRPAGEGSKNASLTIVPAGATTITFSGLGRVTPNEDGSARITQVDIDVPADILDASESRDLRILVSEGGQILMCDPNISATDDPRKCP